MTASGRYWTGETWTPLRALMVVVSKGVNKMNIMVYKYIPNVLIIILKRKLLVKNDGTL
jgi:hypothetical protein